MTQTRNPIWKEDGSWTRADLEKAISLTQLLEAVFKLPPSQNTQPEAVDLRVVLEEPHQLSQLPKLFTVK